MIEKELEAIFAGQDVGDGGVDVDGVLRAFDRLMAKVTKANLPTLISAIQSPRNNFWTRELLSEPICNLGGSDHLEVLFAAAKLGEEEGHDNDGFNTHLIGIASTEPAKCRAKLQELLARDDFKERDKAMWLLEFCEADNSN